MLRALTNLLLPPKSQEQFTEEAAAYVRREEGTKCAIAEPLQLEITRGTESPSTLNLHNAYALYLQNRTKRKEIIQRFVDSVRSVDCDRLVPAEIVPIIKDKGYVLEVREQMKRKGGDADKYFVTEEFNSDLDIVYAVDSPSSIRYLTPENLPEIDLQGETLRSLAIGNLKRILPAIEIQGNPPAFFLSAGGMFESSILLLDRVWNKTELGITGEIVVAVPSREVLMVGDSANETAVKTLRAAAADIAARSPYRLTDQLFVRQGTSFVRFEE